MKRLTEYLELASEWLPEITGYWRVDADGAPPLKGGGYKVVRSVSDECAEVSANKSGTA